MVILRRMTAKADSMANAPVLHVVHARPAAMTVSTAHVTVEPVMAVTSQGAAGATVPHIPAIREEDIREGKPIRTGTPTKAVRVRATNGALTINGVQTTSSVITVRASHVMVKGMAHIPIVLQMVQRLMRISAINLLRAASAHVTDKMANTHGAVSDPGGTSRVNTVRVIKGATMVPSTIIAAGNPGELMILRPNIRRRSGWSTRRKTMTPRCLSV